MNKKTLAKNLQKQQLKALHAELRYALERVKDNAMYGPSEEDAYPLAEREYAENLQLRISSLKAAGRSLMKFRSKIIYGSHGQTVYLAQPGKAAVVCVNWSGVTGALRRYTGTSFGKMMSHRRARAAYRVMERAARNRKWITLEDLKENSK